MDWQPDIHGVIAEVRRRLSAAQEAETGPTATKADLQATLNRVLGNEVQAVQDYLDEVELAIPHASLDGRGAAATFPVARGLAIADEDWVNLVSGAKGLAGITKWLPYSTGTDIFVRRDTVVKAPHDGRVKFAWEPIAGTKWQVGRMILVYPDGRAVRFRHVHALVADGAVERGQGVARVYDESMDSLTWPKWYPKPPDGYQHLDLSLATNEYRLNPLGGAGGDVSSFQHVWVRSGGIPGISLIPHTPGPPEGSSLKSYPIWAAWAGIPVA